MLIRTVLLIISLLAINVTMAQKPQKIAYIDMEYILENVPEYTDAQELLKTRVISWQQRLDGLRREIEIMKVDLSNEKALLTNDLVEEREEDIQIKELDLSNLQAGYFGPTGDLYMLRKQLVRPVQDQIYNAVQEISVQKKYDMVFDKSSDLIMLYSNKKYDISDLVLNKIVKGRKVVVNKSKKPQDIKDCHILFVSASEKESLTSILTELKNSKILMTGDMQNFAQHGGVIGFVYQDKKIGFEINVDAARRAGITISSRLLNLAKVIKDSPQSERN